MEASVGLDQEIDPPDEEPVAAVVTPLPDGSIPEDRDPVTATAPAAPAIAPPPLFIHSPETLQPIPAPDGPPVPLEELALPPAAGEVEPLQLPAPAASSATAPPLFEFQAPGRVKRQLSDPESGEELKSPRRAYVVLQSLYHPLKAAAPPEYQERTTVTELWLNDGRTCTTTTPSASTFIADLPVDDADWRDVARRITSDQETGEVIEYWTLCGALLEGGSLVLQSRLEPWRATVQAEASVTSRIGATAKPPLTLKQKKAPVK